MSRRCAAVLLVAMMCVLAAPLRAQGNIYVPLDDPAYTYVDALIARGGLRSLSALERPYTVAAVRRAIANDTANVASLVIAEWYRALGRATDRFAADPSRIHFVRVAITPPADSIASFTGQMDLEGGATLETSSLRELMLGNDTSGARPFWGGRLLFESTRLGAFTRARMDWRLLHDPEFHGRKDRSVAGRVDDAYLVGRWPLVEAFFGRTARNWGPSTQSGLQLGDYAYTYDHAYLRVGPDAFHIQLIAAQLDTLAKSRDSVYQRYFVAHRLAMRHRQIEAAFGEGVVFGGIGRPFQWGYLNPLHEYQLAQNDEIFDGNVNWSAELAWRTTRRGVYSGQLFIDDFQIDRCKEICHEPSSTGLTFTAEGIPLAGDQRWFASYTRISNLTYRTPQPWERYEVFGVGLGRGFSDYDEIKAGLDLAVLSAAPLRVYAAYRRQGEGDYRIAYPDTVDYPTTPEIFNGVVMTVKRIGVSGGASYGVMQLSGDVGYNWVKNAEHVTGKKAGSMEARLKVTIEPGLGAAVVAH